MHLRIRPKEFLMKRIPIFSWLPKYKVEDGLADLVAGITVGLTLIPQAIAYSALAGLSPQYGLYSAFAGSFIYIFFGTTPEVNIGPTALISLLTFTYTHDTDPKMTVLLCFLSGCVQFLCGVFQLGFLVEFVSIPVTVGFTSATSLIIASSQLKGLLGLSFNAETFVDTWRELIHHITFTKPWDTCLSLACCGTLLTLRRLKDFKITPLDGKTLTKNQETLKKALWFISVGRNAMVVVLCALIAVIFDSYGNTPFLLTGKIDPGLPPVAWPEFNLTYGNATHAFPELVTHFGSGLIVVPLIALLGNIAIAKAFSHGRVVDATQEMMTLGLCNIAGSFFSSYPVSGSFSRSAVNNASGVRTPMGGLYTGTLVVLALAFLTPYFYYIPKATLSSVIICAVIFMVEVSAIEPMWKTNKMDLVTMIVTFFTCLFLGVELGILIGIAVDICFVLYMTARPKISVREVAIPNGPSYLMVTPTGGLLFPAVDHVRSAVTRACNQNKDFPIVLNCSHLQKADYTAAEGLNSLANDFHKLGKRIIYHGLQPPIFKLLTAAHEPKFIISSTDGSLTQILKDLDSPSDFDVLTEKPKCIKKEGQIMEISSTNGTEQDSKTKTMTDVKIDNTRV